MFMQKKFNPQLALIISMTIFGTIPLFVRNISIPSTELALYRAVLAVVLIGAFLLLTKQRIHFSDFKKEIPLLVFSGVAVGINWILLFEAYKYTTVSVATLSYYFAPVIVAVVCPILFKEKFTVKQILCFVFSTVGLVLITGIGKAGGSRGIIGIALGLGAALFYATAVILNKFIKNVSGIHRTFLQFVSAIAVLFPYVFFTGGFTLSEIETKGWINLLIVGFVHTGFAYCLYFASLKELTGHKAAILSYIDPLVAVMISVTVLDEKMTAMQVVGGVMILGFTLFDSIKLKSEKKNED